MTRIICELALGVVIRHRNVGSNYLRLIRRDVDPAALPLGDDGHELGAHASLARLFAYVVESNGSAAVHAGRAAAVHRAVLRRLAGLDLEAHLAVLADGLDVPLFTLLLGEVERPHKDRLVPAGGVGTLDGAGPQPRDDGGFAAALVGRHTHLGI